MTVKFMVLGGPRSATTWAANWLTTDTTLCLHDPLVEYTLRNLDRLTIPGKEIGISCTSTLLFPEWFVKHPARKILLYRDTEEINTALDALGLARLDMPAHNARVQVAVKAGVELWHWDAILDRASAGTIWKHLLPRVPFDVYRHDLLLQFNVQPHWKRLPISREAVLEHIKRVHEAVVHES